MEDQSQIWLVGAGIVALAVAGGVYFAYKPAFTNPLTYPVCPGGCPTDQTCVNGTCQPTVTQPGSTGGCPSGYELSGGQCVANQSNIIVTGINPGSVAATIGDYQLMQTAYLKVTVKNIGNTAGATTLTGLLEYSGKLEASFGAVNSSGDIATGPSGQGVNTPAKTKTLNPGQTAVYYLLPTAATYDFFCGLLMTAKVTDALGRTWQNPWITCST